MRSPITTSPKGLQVRAIAGTYVVLLAFDCTKAYTKNVLGFGIKREDHENGEVIWLRGLKKFDLPASDDGDDVSTRHHPIQKFHWGDYTTKPGRSYTYTICTMKGSPGALTPADEVAVKVTCEKPEQIGPNGHAVHFNRSAAASQAFAKRFPSIPATGEIEDPEAQKWVSRGLAEALIKFIDDTKKGEGLHLFVYEFTKDDFLDALKRAKTRGVKLQIIYDQLLDKEGKGPSLESEPKIAHFGLKTVARGRNGKGINISHNKFMVRSDGKATPKAKAVWTGSTNWTDSGVYAQTNVGHAISDPALAGVYLDWHQAIWQAPDMDGATSRTTVEGLTAIPSSTQAGTALVLSPRKDIKAVTEIAKRIKKPKAKLVCFTAPFQLHDDLEAALEAAQAQVFGLLNKDGVVEKALHEAPNTVLATAAALSTKSALESWQKGMLEKESLHHSGVFIHTKIVLVDPLSAKPLVITGSANMSTNSCKNNDENQLFIAGETEVADVYLGEFMRMFDHYRFRTHMREAKKKQAAGNKKAGFLAEDDSWASEYFSGKSREAERNAFF